MFFKKIEIFIYLCRNESIFIMNFNKILVAGALTLMLSAGSCSSQKSAATADTAPSADENILILPGKGIPGDRPIAGTPPRALPKTLLYRTSGNYNDRVPVQLGADGQLISFPAPTDIPADAQPIQLAYGWLLSRVGVSANSVFTRWTFEEYRALSQTPSPEEILKAVIPGAKVTMTMEAPMTHNEALADTTAVNEFIMANQIVIAPTR